MLYTIQVIRKFSQLYLQNISRILTSSRHYHLSWITAIAYLVSLFSPFLLITSDTICYFHSSHTKCNSVFFPYTHKHTYITLTILYTAEVIV